MRISKHNRILLAVQNLKHHRGTCALHYMTFEPIPEECKPEMEKHQRERFESWWDSWILPKLEEIEEALKQ